MKELYLFSKKMSRRTPFTLTALYLFFRTMCVFLLSLAAAVLLSYFVTFQGMTQLMLVIVVSGWITVGFGFFGGVIYLMNQE